ncbi:MAG TPA: 6-phosphofructokinase [Candidatus Hydrogenedentes bacterium]|nr:6-phosphofructokinase [Candidatus Hydrogenedentota bacterium]HOK89174.1 6-phosphofructokinase [Candidatus Hydrogenedentota bacterium]HOV61873.1 6-phosphofructokinase [Candidatus Hydrogenedentota bacterium]
MKRIGVLTSGGDAPGMNAAIRAVVRAGVAHDLEVYGIERGYQGMIENAIRPLTSRDVSGIINRGGTILRTARSRDFMTPDGRARAAENLRRHGIEGLVVIGGDGSYRGAACLQEEHGMAVIGLPGTIDNDIGGTQFTIGFDTALNVAVEAIDRVHDTADAHDRVFFVEVMGRHSGFIGIMSAIAGGAEAVMVPEEPYTVDQLIADMRACRERGKRSMIVVVAEGDEAGGAFEIARQVMDRSDFKDCRVTVIGHLQRGGAPTAFDRILASSMGVRAVEALLEGASGKMVAIQDQRLVLRPLADSWGAPNRFDPDLLRVCRVLAT